MKHQWKPLLLVAYVFVFTGAFICMNDVLLPSLKEFFSLSFVQATFIQQSFYLVYLIFPVPLAYYLSRYGYKIALATALLVCGAGAALFFPAFRFASYPIALTALFVISVGVTLVNVAANPLAALLGDPSGSHVRVNFVQLFSRLGFTLTPVFATRLIYAESGANDFHIPYLIIGAGAVFFAILVIFSAMPSLKPAKLSGFTIGSIFRESKKYPQLYFGAVAMFFYMGAEAGTAGFFISYLKEVSEFDADTTAQYLSYYNLAATLMSLLAIYLLQVISAPRLLGIFSIAVIVLYLLAAFTNTPYNPLFLVAMGLFTSIMFPCIFSLAIEHLSGFTEKGSALVNMAIVGGAVFPPLQGFVADALGVQRSYLVPACCILVVVAFATMTSMAANRKRQL